MRNYYNENDPFAAQWLRNLIAAGLIPAGDVDDRSIRGVKASDLKGYTQCHFFAGIGGWSLALRLAGWPEERPIWTGSCPCQPFSNAGKGAGSDDPRHLWPDFIRLIRGRRPPVVMGEQVAGSAGYRWLDGVRADLAGEGYASRGVDIPACAVDAPHLRSRIYWVAVAGSARGHARLVRPAEGGAGHSGRTAAEATGSHGSWGVADADRNGLVRRAIEPRGNVQYGAPTGWPESHYWPAGGDEGRNGSFWSASEWLTCQDGKSRRAEPGLPLLVDGIRGRVAFGDAYGRAAPHAEADAHQIYRQGAWKGVGNAIVPQEAEQVIRAYMDVAA